MNEHHPPKYYVPEASHWPIVGSIGLFLFMLGIVNWLHGNWQGPWLFLLGSFIVAWMLVGWFGTVISENRAGLLDHPQIDRSFRLGMIWFIFTEVMFFGAFFAALFYARYLAVPWLGGAGHGEMTHSLLWPDFQAQWPLYQTPDPSQFTGPKGVLNTWGIPAINTLILLSSGVTITVAHWALLQKQRAKLLCFHVATIVLGLIFLGMQAYEYHLAYFTKDLRLESGIYGNTFFMLTGFHAMHVTVGLIILGVIFHRLLKGDFMQHDHFGFEAAAWYWHFVDVVWLALFVFVYWM